MSTRGCGYARLCGGGVLEEQCPDVEVQDLRKWGYPDEGGARGLVVVWMSQHEGNLMKLTGCPQVEVQLTLLQYSLRSFFKHHHHTPGFIQGVAIGNYCSHLKTFLLPTLHFIPV